MDGQLTCNGSDASPIRHCTYYATLRGFHYRLNPDLQHIPNLYIDQVMGWCRNAVFNQWPINGLPIIWSKWWGVLLFSERLVFVILCQSYHIEDWTKWSPFLNEFIVWKHCNLFQCLTDNKPLLIKHGSFAVVCMIHSASKLSVQLYSRNSRARVVPRYFTSCYR